MKLNFGEIIEVRQKPNVLVCQHGARRRYAIPRMFEEAGVLSALFTDASVYSSLGRFARAFGGYAPKKVQRLSKRQINGVPEEKIFSSDSLIYSDLIRKIRNIPRSEYDQWCRILSRRMEVWVRQVDTFNIVYNMFCENLEFIRHVRNNYDAKIISDIYVHPYVGQIVMNESNILGMHSTQLGGIQDIEMEHIYAICEVSDVLLCPSRFVADGVVSLDKKFAEKIVTCPYGSSIQYVNLIENPKKGRVFWAGGDWIRKGLHILAAAADSLIAKYPDLEFRIAGLEDKGVLNMPIFKSLMFLGKLDNDQMRQEFLTADCFALPSIAEGMAGVAIEASAAGCPVITTKSSGMDGIIHGVNGFIVQEGHVKELSAAIERLYLDRDLRQRVSIGAKELSKNYTEEAWKNRLIRVLTNLLSDRNE